MATIVTNTEIGGRFILLGGGYGAFKSSVPSMVFGNLAPKTEHAEHSLALVSNSDGQLGWMEVAKIRVVSVDGVSPGDAIRGAQQ